MWCLEWVTAVVPTRGMLAEKTTHLLKYDDIFASLCAHGITIRTIDARGKFNYLEPYFVSPACSKSLGKHVKTGYYFVARQSETFEVCVTRFRSNQKNRLSVPVGQVFVDDRHIFGDSREYFREDGFRFMEVFSGLFGRHQVRERSYTRVPENPHFPFRNKGLRQEREICRDNWHAKLRSS